MDKEGQFKDVKSADALGTLSRRSSSSRTAILIISVAGFIAVAFLIGMLYRVIVDGTGAPEVPAVEL